MPFKNKKYSYRFAVKAEDLFTDEFIQELNIKTYYMDGKPKRGFRNKSMWVRKVFMTFLRLVLEDMIDNNVSFISPSRHPFFLKITEMSKVSVDRITRVDGIYEDVDLVNTDFTFYEVRFECPYIKSDPFRSVRISYGLYKKLVKNANNGQKYYTATRTKMENYIDELQSRFPEVPEAKLRKICVEGSNRIVHHIVNKKDVKLFNRMVPLQVVFFKPKKFKQ